MTDLYSGNYTKAYVNKPSEKIGSGEQNGHKKIMYSEHLYADNVNSIGDVIYMGKLPAGARVLGGYTKALSTGTTGIFDVGYLANGVDAIDVNAFAAAQDSGGANPSAIFNGSGIGQEFTAETTVVCTLTEATDAAAGISLKIWVEYIVD